MKRYLLIFSIIIGLVLLFVFPVLGIVSYFQEISVNNSENDLIKIEESSLKDKKIMYSYDDEKIIIDNILEEDIIVDSEIPLSSLEDKSTKKQILTGKDVKANYLAHKEEIEKEEMFFEVITLDGENLFFKTFDELEFFIKDNVLYEKTFVIDENEKLLRYVFLTLS